MITEIFFRTNLIFLRKINDYTYAALAAVVNKDPVIVKEWCHGTLEPTLLEVAMLAHFLRIKMEDLFLNDLRNNQLLFSKKGRNLYAKFAFQNSAEGLEDLLKKYQRLITQKNRVVIDLLAVNATQESLIITQNQFYRKLTPFPYPRRRKSLPSNNETPQL
ncbi:MAG: hypothetical protein DI539_26570 [Flavobacterium psychrophilum]|nr:MAG: hypothetical protein DI539_26570 [Flavobacterium psychrophilum]